MMPETTGEEERRSYRDNGVIGATRRAKAARKNRARNGGAHKSTSPRPNSRASARVFSALFVAKLLEINLPKLNYQETDWSTAERSRLFSEQVPPRGPNHVPAEP